MEEKTLWGPSPLAAVGAVLVHMDAGNLTLAKNALMRMIFDAAEMGYKIGELQAENEALHHQWVDAQTVANKFESQVAELQATLRAADSLAGEVLTLRGRVHELESAYNNGTCQCDQEGNNSQTEKAHGTYCPEQAAALMAGYCKRIKELKNSINPPENWPRCRHDVPIPPEYSSRAGCYNCLLEENAKLKHFVEDIRDNYDCDEDGHKYNTYCRVCDAKKIVGEKTP